MSETSFLVAINQNYRDKVKPGDGRFWDFNMTFQNTRLTLPQLLQVIRAGHAWCAPHRQVRHHRPTRRNPDYHTTYRVKANVISSQLLALDSDTEDERSSFLRLLDDPFIRQYAGLLHATASATPARPRTRIIFVLARPLHVPTYELALKALLARYPFCDQSVNHAAAVFYGSRDCNNHLTENILPETVLVENIIEPYQQRLLAAQARRAAARRERLARYGVRDQPEAEQVTRYALIVRDNLLHALAQTSSGQGLRHQRLFIAALTIGGLRSAPWLSPQAQRQLAHAEEDLLDAVVANGYVADYGEEDAWRTIDNGLAQGEAQPMEEPMWYAERPFFQVGDEVRAIVRGRVLARGRVHRYRERDHWEYELDTRPHVWFARALLRPVDPES